MQKTVLMISIFGVSLAFGVMAVLPSGPVHPNEDPTLELASVAHSVSNGFSAAAQESIYQCLRLKNVQNFGDLTRHLADSLGIPRKEIYYQNIHLKTSNGKRARIRLVDQEARLFTFDEEGFPIFKKILSQDQMRDLLNDGNIQKTQETYGLFYPKKNMFAEGIEENGTMIQFLLTSEHGSLGCYQGKCDCIQTAHN